MNTNTRIKWLEITENGDGYAISEDNKLFSTVKLKLIPSDIGDSRENTPFSFTLSQNYPNPFNPETVIKFSIPETGPVKGVVYDILGREVRTLLNGDMSAGNHEVKFDAKGIASGIYVFRLEAGKNSLAIKMVVGK
ncbi:MAG: T9SS type A sorting domain-containing protein [Ignavibacteriales bacterium]|nr:T9SS type A sorting domain-containing protein [Ignavibacteriales bacterium]